MSDPRSDPHGPEQLPDRQPMPQPTDLSNQESLQTGAASRWLVPSGVLDAASALHVFTVGAIGLMTLAIMSRATRGHTGMPLTASPLTAISYGLLVVGAGLRPSAMLLPDHYLTLVSFSGLCWMMAFALYLVEYSPALLTRRKPRPE